MRLVEDGGVRLRARVARGELHLALGAVPSGEELRARSLFPVWVLAVMPSGHRLARRRAFEVAELDDESVLLLRRDFASRLRFDAACEAARVRPRILLEAGDPHSLVSLARGGHGIAVVPSTPLFSRSRLHVAPLLRSGALGAAAPHPRLKSRRVAIWRRRMIALVGARPIGHTSVQVPWPWQRASASSDSSTDQRAAVPASRESRWSVKARVSAAGPGNCGLWATIVHADRHMPQPMHSMAGSISRRSADVAGISA